MFIIATSGRCGTKAICDGLAQFSDHEVRHEPAPTLLEEAWLKHNGQDYRTPVYSARMAEFAERNGNAYGESFRAPNLLRDIKEVAPATKFLIVVRTPAEYIRSAHSKGVLRKNDTWDRFRLMPPLPGKGTLAARIAMHWKTINDYLLDFAEHSEVPVVTHRDWFDLVDLLPHFLGVRITNSAAVSNYWNTRPNASIGRDLPDGFDNDVIGEITGSTWQRAQRMSAS